jgi:hypothetical protein
MAVVAQHYEGHPSSLITQVASRITRLEAMGWRLDAMVFVSNGRTDPDAVAARSVLTRGLLARLSSTAGGRFILTSTDAVDSRACRQLVALANALQEDAATCGVVLGVRSGLGATLYGENGDDSDEAAFAHAS